MSAIPPRPPVPFLSQEERWLLKPSSRRRHRGRHDLRDAMAWGLWILLFMLLVLAETQEIRCGFCSF